MSPDNWKVASILVGGLATLAIFSFLWKENPFYRLFEHIYIGIGVGIGAVFTVQNFLWPIAFRPVWCAVTRHPLTNVSDPASYAYLLYIPFMLFGLLYYFIYSKKRGWLARVAIGFGLGAGGLRCYVRRLLDHQQRFPHRGQHRHLRSAQPDRKSVV